MSASEGGGVIARWRAELRELPDNELLARLRAVPHPGQDDQAVEHAIDMEAVHAHLEDLPEREQRILILRFYGNLTQAEIGQRLGISQMHVSRLLTRALAYLRGKLTSEPDTDSSPAKAGT